MTLYLITVYYNIFLTDTANKVCMITTPFVKYKYNSLQMGVYIPLDIFQERFSEFISAISCYYIGLIQGALSQGLGSYEATPNGWDQVQD